MEEKFTIGAIVENHFGVLNRVAGLFAKRGYNINSLAVGETDDPRLSRMTIVVSGDDYVKEQMLKQLNKLFDVRKVILLENDSSVLREHMLIKLSVMAGNNDKITDMINKYGGKVIDFSTETITVEITGDVQNNDSFINESRQYGILEVCRAGAVALARGNVQ